MYQPKRTWDALLVEAGLALGALVLLAHFGIPGITAGATTSNATTEQNAQCSEEVVGKTMAGGE